MFNVGNQFGTSLSTHVSNFDDIWQCWIFAVLWRPFWKWRPVEIVQWQESIRDIIIYPHIKFWWYRTMLNFCSIVAAILKMATGRNFSMSEINLGHHYLPTYQILMISDNVEFLRYCGCLFENGDRYKLFNVGNQFGTSLSTHISNFDDIGQCWIFTAHFLYRILAVILKMADISKFWKRRIAPLMVTYTLGQILCLYHYTFRSYQH